MSKYIRATVPETCEIVNTSCWHVGAKAFHEKAAQGIIDWCKKKKNRFLTIGGDIIEGKTIDSPHFNPEGLNPKRLNIHAQADAAVEILRPVAGRLLMLQLGNHELYLRRDFDVIRYICQQLGRPEVQGDYQTWLNLNGVLTLHFWHGRPSMPRGAKDPIQREANQKAWLKNRLEPLAGSAHAQYMAHTHSCLVVPPREQYALMDSGEDVKGVFFRDEPRNIGGSSWVAPDARWYVNTGTLRRSGGFDFLDYAEIAGYAPVPMAYTITRIRDNRIEGIEKVIA